MLMQGEVKQVSITLLEGHTAAQWFSQLSKNEYITDDIQSESSLYSALMSIDNSFVKMTKRNLKGVCCPILIYLKRTPQLANS